MRRFGESKRASTQWDLAVRTKVFAVSTGYQRWRASKLLPIVGCLIDMFSATVVIVPLLVPLGAAYGVHPVCDRDCTEPA